MTLLRRLFSTLKPNSTMSIPSSTYKFNHTMFRITDPKKSIPFYQQNFGFELLKEMPVNELGFTNYFLAIKSQRTQDKDKPWYEREGVLEMCHNHGAENGGVKVNNGNEQPHRGFGHIAISVDNIEEACKRLEENGVTFKKKLSDGRQKNIAFAYDPDGYWIELITNHDVTPQPNVHDKQNNLFNHSMIRVKDADKSLAFYQNTLGMKLLNTKEMPDAKFTLYFLGFANESDKSAKGVGVSDREGVLELTWNWGTEKESGYVYHNGNDKGEDGSIPQGYGHIGITVDDVKKEMDRFESQSVRIKKRMQDGKMKFIGFIMDPDGYWIEILPRADIPKKILE